MTNHYTPICLLFYQYTRHDIKGSIYRICVAIPGPRGPLSSTEWCRHRFDPECQSGNALGCSLASSSDHLVTHGARSHSKRDIASLVTNDCYIVLPVPSPHLLIHLMWTHIYWRMQPCRFCMKSAILICNWMEKLLVPKIYPEIKQIVQFREHLQIWRKIFLSMNIIMPKSFYAISNWRFILNQIILWCRVLGSFSHNVRTSKMHQSASQK